MFEKFRKYLIVIIKRTKKQFYILSILSMGFIITISIILLINRIENTWDVKEFTNKDENGWGEKIVLQNNKYFRFYSSGMEYYSEYKGGKWDLKGDTLILNGTGKVKSDFNGKVIDFPEFKNAKYKIYDDSIVLIKGQDCIFKFFYTYDKYWVKRIKEQWRIDDLIKNSK